MQSDAMHNMDRGAEGLGAAGALGRAFIVLGVGYRHVRYHTIVVHGGASR